MTTLASPPEKPPVATVPESEALSPLESGLMSVTEHLAELRQRFIVCFSTVAVTTTVTFLYATPLIQALQRLAPKGTLFVQLTPGEVFLSSFKLSMLAGIGLALPVILYHVVRFLSPGLEAKERRMVFPLLMLGLGLFCGGVAFGYRIILPLMLNFLLDYGQTVAQNQLSIAKFLDFCNGFLFATGLVFQIPIVLLLAAFLGFVSSATLLKQWKAAIVASFLLGAIITPSADPFSQTIMAASLYGLYGFSLLLIRLFRK